MGQACACFEETILQDADEKAVSERLKSLVAGAKFKRNAFLGLSQQELFVSLSEDLGAIQWRTENTWTAKEHGEVDLTSEVRKVRSAGEQGLQFIGLDDKAVFEIKTEDAALRDKWLVALNELLQSWVDEPSSKPRSKVSAAGASDKAEYFKRREDEIKAREKANAERKAKYAANGMKYTAQVMAERS